MISLNPIKDQSLSIEVEAWLKNNEAQKLKMGESLGQVDFNRKGPSTRTVEENVKTEKERERKLIDRQRAKKQDATESHRIALEQRLIKQQHLVAYFRKNAKMGDLQRFMKQYGYSKNILVYAQKSPMRTECRFNAFEKNVKSFEFSVKKKTLPKEEISRMQLLSKLKHQAVVKGLKEFKAPCRNHGMTEFFITPKGKHKCRECVKEWTKRDYEKSTPDDVKENTIRKKENREKMLAAIEKGEKTFIGDCIKHGETLHIISRNRDYFQYRCRECKSKDLKKFDSKRKLK